MNKITGRYTYRFAVMLALSMSACGDATAGAKTVTAYAQAHSSSKSTIQQIEIGKSFSLEDINAITGADYKLTRLYTVECGSFFLEDDEEIVYQYGPMAVNVAGGQAAIMKIIGIPDSLNIKYKGLLIDNRFKPNKLSAEKFEVDEYKVTAPDNVVDIETTTMNMVYDTQYTIRERSSDDLLYLYYMNNKAVAVQILIQC